MVKFELNGINGHKILTYPTKLEEITPEFLRALTEEIVPAPNYSLVAICYREKLHNVIFTAEQKKGNLQTAVVPVFVRTNTDSPFIAECGEKLVIAGSQIALGHHVSAAKNTLTIDTLLYFAKNDGRAYSKALGIKDYVYFLEFKLIPNNDIVGIYTDVPNVEFDNPFKIEDATPEGLTL